ncbi:MAG: hypothetical protein NT023_05590 [Armatimonadetes bacterium]|nr:hypothetical protein [Armatimonadota bacterium]
MAGMLALRVGLLVAEGDGAELEQLFAYASHRVSRPLTTSLGSMVQLQRGYHLPWLIRNCEQFA